MWSQYSQRQTIATVVATKRPSWNWMIHLNFHCEYFCNNLLQSDYLIVCFFISRFAIAYNLIRHQGAGSLMLREEHPIISFKLDCTHLSSLHLHILHRIITTTTTTKTAETIYNIYKSNLQQKKKSNKQKAFAVEKKKRKKKTKYKTIKPETKTSMHLFCG